jgi:hypothetical protein
MEAGLVTTKTEHTAVHQRGSGTAVPEFVRDALRRIANVAIAIMTT